MFQEIERHRQSGVTHWCIFKKKMSRREDDSLFDFISNEDESQEEDQSNDEKESIPISKKQKIESDPKNLTSSSKVVKIKLNQPKKSAELDLQKENQTVDSKTRPFTIKLNTHQVNSKASPTNLNSQPQTQVSYSQSPLQTSSNPEQVQNTPQLQPKKRGRPRKYHLDIEPQPVSNETPATSIDMPISKNENQPIESNATQKTEKQPETNPEISKQDEYNNDSDKSNESESSPSSQPIGSHLTNRQRALVSGVNNTNLESLSSERVKKKNLGPEEELAKKKAAAQRRAQLTERKKEQKKVKKSIKTKK